VIAYNLVYGLCQWLAPNTCLILDMSLIWKS